MSVPEPARGWGQLVGCLAMTSSGRPPVDLFVLPPSECGCDTPVGIPGGSEGGREVTMATFWQQTQVLGHAFFFPVCCIAMATDSSPGLAEMSGLPVPLNC